MLIDLTGPVVSVRVYGLMAVLKEQNIISILFVIYLQVLWCHEIGHVCHKAVTILMHFVIFN